MCGHTMRDNIRNEVIREEIGVTSMVNKMRETRLIVWTCEIEMYTLSTKEVREA